MLERAHDEVPFNKIYFFLGLLCFAFYGIGHSLYGNSIVALSCLVNCIALVICLVLKTLGKLKLWHNDLLIGVLSLTLIIVCGQLGIRGLIIAFPLVVGYFYYFPLKMASRLSVLFLFPAFFAASFSMPPDMVLRSTIPFIMTVTISYLYAEKVAQQKSKLRDEAESDYLTGIQNRRSLIRWLNEKIIKKDNQDAVSLLFLDIDDFKIINDQFGHSFGDKVLIKIAQRIEQIQANDIDPSQQSLLARVAGDGFVIALCGKYDSSFLSVFGETLLAKVNQDYAIGEVKIQVNFTIGIATNNSHQSIDELIHSADVAMYKAKQNGKNRIAFFNNELAQQAQQRSSVSTQLKTALESGDFYLVYMPIYDADAQSIDGAEVLLRSHNPVLSSMGPDVYIRIAEEQGLIGQIDAMVIEMAFSSLQGLQHVIDGQPFTLAINISSQQLKNRHFPDQVLALAEKYQINPEQIELEITETSLVEHDTSSIDVIQHLKRHGFSFALDDFGTGYTAFNQLRNLPVDTLKIDRSFIGNINDDGVDQGELVDVILSLAQRYKLNVVAEGVENQHQLNYLIKRNCAHFQGYYLSKPIEVEQLIALMDAQQIQKVQNL